MIPRVNRIGPLPIILSAALVGGPLGVLRAQATTRDTATLLPSQLTPPARLAIERVMDSLRAARLPTAPVAAKAAEGVLKGADEKRIVAAIRALAKELGEAREAIGPSSTEAELVAAASALHVGVPEQVLRRLREVAIHAGAEGTLATPLVVLTDLVSRRVPPLVAGSAVDSLLARRAPSAEFGALRAAVERDIAAGLEPDASTMHRTRTILETLRRTSPRP
jgi:hypothetical protein